MAATGYTPISLYYSTTAAAAPLNTSLVNGELAINITDGKLYYKDNAGVVQTIASKNANSGTFSNATVSGNLTLSGGTANGVLYLNGSNVATSGSGLVFDGTNFGIGIASPGARLNIASTGSTTADGLRLTFGSEARAHNIYSAIATGRDLTVAPWRSLTIQTGNGIAEGIITLNSYEYTVFGIGASNAEQMRLTSTGLGIGTSSPAGILDVSSTTPVLTASQSNTTVTSGMLIGAFNAYSRDVSTTSTGGVGGIRVFANTDYNTSYTPSYMSFYTHETTPNDGTLLGNPTERMRLDSSGNLGLGVTPSAWGSFGKVMQIGDGGSIAVDNIIPRTRIITNAYSNGTDWIYLKSLYAGYSVYNSSDGSYAWFTAPSGTAGNTITFTQAMTLNASGNLGVGTSSPTDLLSVGTLGTGNAILTIGSSTSGSGNIYFGDGTGADRYRGYIEYGHAGDSMAFGTAGAERARITSGGELLVGKTTTSFSTQGLIVYNTGAIDITRSAAQCLALNRLSNDGNLQEFYQDNTLEGTISVSGTTVSYNAFAGSHWSQLQDNSKPEILRGTVMESIDELCEWPDETQSERLCRVKISDTVGSKKVYGVFMDWDNDWTATNDMLVTALGAFVCRVNGSVEVQQGDLLESNGDGTARVQADDIIRSSTIGKVTSTVKTHEHPDGSYCVPTVLYCG